MRRSLDPKVQRLRQIPGMGTIPDTELNRLAALVDECQVPEGTVLVREGAPARSSYVIVDGWAAVTIAGTPIAVLGPGEHLGEMAILDNGVRSATVTAKTPMRVLEIGPVAIAAFLAQPDMLRTIARGLATRLRAADTGTHRGAAASSPRSDE